MQVRTGAKSNTASEIAAKSPPDGYTLLGVTRPQTLSIARYPKRPYDPGEDLAPVSLVVAWTSGFEAVSLL